MKFGLLFLFSSISQIIAATTYYIDPIGSNSNDGSSAKPWLTLSFACSQVKVSGDIIHVNPGTYIETAQCILAVGVSIEGDGVSSIIDSRITAANTPTIKAVSTGVIMGNQHISFLKMTGNDYTAWSAIRFQGRSNVSVHDCIIENFLTEGVGIMNTSFPPTTWITGCSFYNNIITNSSKRDVMGYGGCLQIAGVAGMMIYNNTLTISGRKSTDDGQTINACIGYWKDCKIYSNYLTVQPYSGEWNFSLELKWSQGGNEIYNNTIYGVADFCYNYCPSPYTYSIDIHDNIIGLDKTPAFHHVGIESESDSYGLIIRNNHLKNCSIGIHLTIGFQTTDRCENIYIYNNVISNLGLLNTTWGAGISLDVRYQNTLFFNNINIWNNVIDGTKTATTTPTRGIQLPGFATSTNINICNNIITGFSGASIYAFLQVTGSTIDYLSIENNIMFNNGNSNNPLFSGITPTHYNNLNNKLNTNPIFVSTTDYHLQPLSPGINAGKYVGLPYLGSFPDIGAFETSSAPSQVPVYVSSVIEDATPAKLEMSFDITLSNFSPVASAFSVKVNSVNRIVNGVTISGSKVILMLSSPVKYGDIIVISYTKPSINPIKTDAGGEAASLADQAVTNNVNLVNPLYVNSVIENITPAILELNYDLTLANYVPLPSAFDVRVNSIARAISSVTVSGTKVSLILAVPVLYGELITVAYYKPDVNPYLQTPNGGVAKTMGSQSVTNKVNAAIPSYLSSNIENSTPTILEMNYNLTLADIKPVNSAFIIQVNSISRVINSISISGNKVLLTLATPVVYGDVITVTYSKPTTNPLQTANGGQAASISGQYVTNNMNPILPVYVSSVIENANPDKVEMTYNLNLANIVPALTVFSVLVNDVLRTVISAVISGTKVVLTLANPVVFGDIVTVAYVKPGTNPLQTTAGSTAATISAQPVINNCATPTQHPPVIEVNFPANAYSGFVFEIDASGSNDPDNDILTFDWIAPPNVPISSTSGSKIRFLSPITIKPEIIEIELSVSDGLAIQTKKLSINILPYKPEMAMAKIVIVEASNSYSTDYPINVIDGNLSTKWSMDGNNHWLVFDIANPFKISHLQVAFQPNQNFESYFDIYVSQDKILWEPILINAKSCNFSGSLQIFDFPVSKTNIDYNSVKLVGHGNSLNTWNYYSEFKVFGTKGESAVNPGNLTEDISIYPNPASELINIVILEPPAEPQNFRIFDFSGRLCLEKQLDPGLNNFQFSLNLSPGIYIAQVTTHDKLVKFVRKLIVIK